MKVGLSTVDEKAMEKIFQTTKIRVAKLQNFRLCGAAKSLNCCGVWNKAKPTCI